MRREMPPNREFRVAELVKSFGRTGEAPKVLTTSATVHTATVNLDERKS